MGCAITFGDRSGIQTHATKVIGQLVNDIVLDTGCSRTLVRSDLLREKDFSRGETITVQCAHGDVVTYPLARVELEVEGRALIVETAVSNTLPQSVLLRTDVPDLSELLKTERRGKALMVVTCSQAQKEISSNSVQRVQVTDLQSQRRSQRRLNLLGRVTYGKWNTTLMMTCL